MSKKPVKKSAAKKKGVVKKAKTKKALTKTSKTPSKKSKTLNKKSEKEISLRAANLIANSEKKKKSVNKTKRPKRILTKKEANTLLESVIEGMQEKKAKNITILDLHNIESRVCDNFVICDADSKTHVLSIAEGIEDAVYKRIGEHPYHSEGKENSEWILEDYINVVAHVFLRETREHYNIEGLWGDAKITFINN